MGDESACARLIESGPYRVWIDAAGGGRSEYGGLALTPCGRHVERAGLCLYVRDLDSGDYWTTGLEPGRRRPERYGAWIDGPVPRLLRRDGGIETLTEIAVASGVAAELRRVTVTNRSPARRRLEITTFVPVALDGPAAYEGHPAFSKLFVETAYLPEMEGLCARRRPRGPEDPAPGAVHLLCPEDGSDGPPEWETDRARFLGRGRGPAAPAALERSAVLSGTTGSVLDPALSLRRAVTLEAGGVARFTAVLGAGMTLAAARAAAGAAAEPDARRSVFLDVRPGDMGPDRGEAALARLGGGCGEGGGTATHGGTAGEPSGAGTATHTGTPGEPSGAGSQTPGAVSEDPFGGERLLFFNGIGGFSEAGDEYVVRLPGGPGGEGRPPLPWINVVANPRVGFLVSESGAGCTWAGNSRLNRLTPWHNDPVTDPHGEALYLRDEEDGSYWSPTPGPAPGDGPYEARHGFGYSRFRHRGRGLDHEVWHFVAPDDPVRLVRALVTDLGGRERRLSTFAWFDWVLGAGDDARAGVEAWPDPESGAVFARNGVPGGPVAFAAAVAPSGGGGTHVTADREAFLGPRGDPCGPVALRGSPVLEPAEGRDGRACAALQLRLDVGGGERVEYGFVLGQAETEGEARELIARYRRPEALADTLGQTRERWNRLLGRVRVETPSAALDLMANGWLLYQTLSCRLWGRSALYQSGGAYGFRDQLQDVTALVYADPALTRRQILLHAAHQFPEGDVLHWWHPGAEGIRTRFSDDLLWLPYVTAFYVDATGDGAVLEETVPFVEGRSLEPEEDEAYLRPDRSSETADLYEHCCRAIDRSLTRGRHGLPLIGSGDWNDGMNRVGRLGRGESVWLGFFLAAILSRWIPLCESRGDVERACRWAAFLEALREALDAAGWDGGWYRRAFYDDGTPIGSAGSEECRVDAIAQAWAVLSRVAPAGRAERALDALDEHLVDEEEGLIRLLTPPFDRTSRDPGYIKGYLPGVRENGGQYTHGVLWAVRAMAEAGRSERAGALLEMLLPVNHARTPEEVERYRVEPYVVAADVYGVAPHVGRGGWTWYTGSAAWMYRLALESILGMEVRGGDRLRLRPCLPPAWPGYRLTWRPPPGKTEYAIVVERAGDGAPTAAWLDGRSLEVCDGVPEIALERDGRRHELRVELGADARPAYAPRAAVPAGSSAAPAEEISPE